MYPPCHYCGIHTQRKDYEDQNLLDLLDTHMLSTTNKAKEEYEHNELQSLTVVISQRKIDQIKKEKVELTNTNTDLIEVLGVERMSWRN